VTALALTADDHTVYSVSKDGWIAEADVETGKRCCSMEGWLWLRPFALKGHCLDCGGAHGRKFQRASRFDVVNGSDYLHGHEGPWLAAAGSCSGQ
jgi:hypothetical protein